MRLFRLFLLVIGLSAAGLAHAQSQPEMQASAGEEVSLVKSVHLFPNPATEFIDVKLDQLPAANVSLTVHNIIGNQLQVETEILEEDLIRVKVKDLAAGYYLLAIKDEDSNFRGTYKFLKR